MSACLRIKIEKLAYPIVQPIEVDCVRKSLRLTRQIGSLSDLTLVVRGIPTHVVARLSHFITVRITVSQTLSRFSSPSSKDYHEPAPQMRAVPCHIPLS